MKKLLALVLALALLAPAASEAAPPKPFGHACTPQDGVLFCPTSTDAQRVPSWDGVPLDVDVTLPPTGNGPFPTIVMLHGWGGNKDSFESHTPAGDSSTVWHYNNNFFAKRGYAVITRARAGSAARAAPWTRARRPGATTAGCALAITATRAATCSTCSGCSSTSASSTPTRSA
jgi:predicted dienelactone hydrolase